jgi:homoserine dehydrogenase
MATRISVFGLGNVGQALLASFGRVCGGAELVLAADGRGAFVGDSLSPSNVVERKRARDYDRAREPGDAGGLLEEARPDVHVELTPTDLETGSPALDDVRIALGCGIPVVTAAKSHQRSKEVLEEVLALSASQGVPFLDHASTLAGIPATEMVAGIGFQLREVAGVLNGTTNYILKRLGEGAAFDQARDEAVEKGFAERNWRYDLEGMDVAVKLVGLVRHLTGVVIGADTVELLGCAELGLSKGIVGATPGLIERLRAEGRVLKLFGAVSIQDGEVKASVGPRAVALDDPFAHIEGFQNAVRLRGDMNDSRMELFLRGPGAGADETASRVLGNLNHLTQVLGWRATP